MFNWLWRLFKRPIPIDPKHELFGFDTRVWKYLGWTDITYNDTKISIHFFVKEDDLATRRYVARPVDRIRLANRHSWTSNVADPWVANELSLYAPVQTNTSDWLRSYMLTQYSSVWGDTHHADGTPAKWWIQTQGAKYDSATISQAAKPKPKKATIKTVDSTVIKFELPKKD